jgi:hypothetical protein
MGSSDIHLFGHLNKHLAGKQFATDANVKQAVTSYRHIIPVFFYAEIQPSVLRWNKFLSVSDDCREVWCVQPASKLPSLRQSRIKFSLAEFLLLWFLKLPRSTVSSRIVRSRVKISTGNYDSLKVSFILFSCSDVAAAFRSVDFISSLYDTV